MAIRRVGLLSRPLRGWGLTARGVWDLSAYGALATAEVCTLLCRLMALSRDAPRWRLER